MKWEITNKIPPQEQELLEHKSNNTPEIYTHVNIESFTKTPLDHMMEEE